MPWKQAVVSCIKSSQFTEDSSNYRYLWPKKRKGLSRTWQADPMICRATRRNGPCQPQSEGRKRGVLQSLEQGFLLWNSSASCREDQSGKGFPDRGCSPWRNHMGAGVFPERLQPMEDSKLEEKGERDESYYGLIPAHAWCLVPSGWTRQRSWEWRSKVETGKKGAGRYFRFCLCLSQSNSILAGSTLN